MSQRSNRLPADPPLVVADPPLPSMYAAGLYHLLSAIRHLPMSSKEPLLDHRALFRDWYRTEIPRLYRAVTYWIPDEAAAEDLTAAICERALQHLHLYDPQRGSFDRWMFGIARNMLRTDYRTRRQQPALIPLDALAEITSTGGSPEREAEEAETFREVLRHVGMLSPQERDAISLRYGAGYGNKEAAEIMGISANQVGVLLHRALNKLRQAMQAGEEAAR